MNVRELKILSSVIRTVRRDNARAWWQLKWETFDGGLQSYYPAQSIFEWPAKNAVKELSSPQVEDLRNLHSSTRTASVEGEILVEFYAAQIVEEIVRRARVAGYRTQHW